MDVRGFWHFAASNNFKKEIDTAEKNTTVKNKIKNYSNIWVSNLYVVWGMK
jgi:hypothetical protein